MIIHNKKNWASVIISLVFILICIFIPTGYENARLTSTSNEERVSAKILSVDNSNIKGTGLVQTGEQRCKVQLTGGSFRKEIHVAENILSGSMEQDKIYQPGEKALVLVSTDQNKVTAVSLIDHYRLDGLILLFTAFFILLVAAARWTGLRAFLSFVLTVTAIWKIMIPCFLKGINPILTGAFVTTILMFVTITLVFGLSRRSFAACAGSAAGMFLTCILGVLFTNMLKIEGAIMPFSETLLYSGYQHLDLTKIFMASIFIGSSGAVMDLSVDIAAAAGEIAALNPSISRWELIKSSMRVGSAAMGTMTTTLLLAYSGGYVSLLMVFMAQGTPLINMLNYKYVTSEIIHTLVGSFGLVSVAPLTSLFSGIFLTKK